ncbi:MAG: PEGA domain-containing protein [Pseudomonadota bacterium]
MFINRHGIRIVLVAFLFLSLSTRVGLCGAPNFAEEDRKAKAFFKEDRFAEAARVWHQLFLQSSGADELRAAHNLAITFQKLGDDVKVYYFLSYELHRAPATVDTKKLEGALEHFRKRLAPGHGFVQVGSEPDGAQICLKDKDGRNPCFKAPLFWALKPGPHGLRFQEQGFETQSVTIKVKQGANPPRLVRMTPVKGMDIGTKNREQSRRGGRCSWGPWIMVGVGTAALAVGIPFGFVSGKQIIDKDNKLIGVGSNVWEDYGKSYSRNKSLWNTGLGLSAAGGAVVLGGLIWAAVDLSRDEPSSHAGVSPLVIPGGGGLALEVGF